LPAPRYDPRMTLDLDDVLRPEVFVPITVAIDERDTLDFAVRGCAGSSPLMASVSETATRSSPPSFDHY